MCFDVSIPIRLICSTDGLPCLRLCKPHSGTIDAVGGRPHQQWKSARTTNAIQRLHQEFKRRIKTQTVLPSAETAAMLFWALLASGQITMRKVDGWQTLPEKLLPQCIDLAA